MALSFHLVKRPDMRKDAAEGSKLFYAQAGAECPHHYKQ